MTGEIETPRRIKALGFSTPGPIPYQVKCYPPGHQLLVEEPAGFSDRLNRLVKSSGEKTEPTRVDRVFLPAVKHMSARRAQFSEFEKIETLEHSVEVYESMNPSDVVALRRRQGVFFPAAGCLLVVATGGSYCVAGHAGRDSLVCVPGMKREHETVMHAIAESFDRKGIARSNIMVRTFFGLQPEVFPNDPNYGERGAYYAEVLDYVGQVQERISKKAQRLRLKQWGPRDQIVRIKDDIPHLSLYHLLKAQSLLLEIYNTGNEKPLPVDGHFAYTRHSDPALAESRNWVFAYRE